MPTERNALLVALSAAVLLALTAVVGVSPSLAGNADAAPAAQLSAFVGGGGTCGAGGAPWSRTEIRTVDGRTVLRHAGDVTVPDASYALAGRLERVNATTYALYVESEPTEKPAAECLATARYEATVELNREDVTLVFYHDGERATTVAGPSGDAPGTPTRSY